MSREDDDKKAYTTSDDIVGRSIRRGTRKAISALTFGLVKGTDPLSELGQDATRKKKGDDRFCQDFFRQH